MSDDTYQPTFRQTRTILGVTRDLEATTGVTPLNDPQTTLNSKYSVFDTQIPTGPTKLQYFGIGINGRRNVDDGFLTEPREVRQTNMDLYTPIPFIIVPIQNDLDATARANYRMRVVQTIDGQQYVFYYLKKLTIVNSSVTYTRRSDTGVEEPYVVDYSNLSPTPPETPIGGGTVSGSIDEINTTVTMQGLITGQEVHDVINFLYDGDLRYGVISEIGLYSGQDQTKSATDYTDTAFNYTESIMTRLDLHYTFNGIDVSNPSSTETYEFRLGQGNVILW